MKRKVEILLISLMTSVALIIALFFLGVFDSKRIIIASSDNKNDTYLNLVNSKASGLDFTQAAKSTIDAVVHVKNIQKISSYKGSMFDFFFGRRENGGDSYKSVRSGGSGVIITKDGYIVTNNHVVANSNEIEVTLNDNTNYRAKIVGKDESTDIALLKIDADKDLNYTTFSNSDDVKVGEWVLAVGNPFDLTSTVTAGIISAKSRDLGQSQRASLGSFIQTDAAVNSGNSGGALVNIKGELIGINTAITSPTGTFTGYAFAIPSNIAKKVVEDILEFGKVNRAYLGIQMLDLSSDLAKRKNLELDDFEGVYIEDVMPKGAAKESGIKKGDIIIKLDDVKITKSSDLGSYLQAKRPNESVFVTVIREGSENKIEVKLKNTLGDESVDVLGAKVRTPNDKERDYYENELGVKQRGLIVEGLSWGKLKRAGLRQGDLILSVQGKAVASPDKFEDIINELGKNKKLITMKVVGINGYARYITFD